MNKKHTFYRIALAFGAISLAGPAAYFSIFGLSKLYIGAGIAGIILFGAIEFGKIVTVSYLYAFWKTISLVRKTYLTFAVIVAMTLTSIGIYGFLSAAFQTTSTSIETINSQIQVIENKQNMFNKRIDNIKEHVQFRTDRVNKLSNLRTQQEVRLDTLYQRGNFASAKATETNIKETNITIDKLNDEILELNSEIASLNDSVSTYDVKIMELKNNQYQHDLGPLKYVSELLSIPMNKIVNWLTLAIIFVFDPFAIALLIAFNHLTILSKKRKDDEDKISENKPKYKNPFDKLIKKFNKVQSEEIQSEKVQSEEEIQSEKVQSEKVQSEEIQSEKVQSEEEIQSEIIIGETEESKTKESKPDEKQEIQYIIEPVKGETEPVIEPIKEIDYWQETHKSSDIEEYFGEFKNIPEVNMQDKIKDELQFELNTRLNKEKERYEHEISEKLNEHINKITNEKEQFEKKLEDKLNEHLNKVTVEIQKYEENIQTIIDEKQKIKEETIKLKEKLLSLEDKLKNAHKFTQKFIDEIETKIREKITEEMQEKMNERIETIKEQLVDKYEGKRKIIFKNKQ
ncbi:MAG: hypothetical protein HPY57_15210 [Ignavibacteria bacterium]|nr:hypothetical protein [Ignavibacteria bacterium]